MKTTKTTTKLQSILTLSHQLADTQLGGFQGLLLQPDLEALQDDVLGDPAEEQIDRPERWKIHFLEL